MDDASDEKMSVRNLTIRILMVNFAAIHFNGSNLRFRPVALS
jgi:hypothetical protein